MTIKYECPKCNRKFTEWGAEKLGFRCPHDEWCPKDAAGDIELVRVGASEEGLARKPTLRRSIRKLPVAPKPPAIEEYEEVLPEVEEPEVGEEIEVVEAVEDLAAKELGEVTVEEGEEVLIEEEELELGLEEGGKPFKEEEVPLEDDHLDSIENEEWSS